MKITAYPDREMMAMDVADQLASELEACLLHQDHASFAVPGGTTPGPIFDVLSGVGRLDWSRIHVMLTDERWVPEGHARSNTTLVKERLLSGPAAAATFIPFYAEGAAEEEVPALSAALAPELPLSLLVLGMGGDMHTASLFPGAPGLEAALAPDAPALNILRPESQPDLRVSLAGHVLSGAMSKHLVITGTDKRAALEAAAAQSPLTAPIKVAMTDLNVHWAE